MATIKQKKLVKQLLENTSLTTKEAMLKAGYSEGTTKTPSEITQSKGFIELLDKYLPDDKLLAKHDELLEATKQLSARNGRDANAETDDFIEVPDYPVQAKALELGYKVKGKLQDKQVNVQVNNVIPILGELKAE